MDEVVPKVVREIIDTITRLSRSGGLDVSRLSYELNQAEWREFADYLDGMNRFTTNFPQARFATRVKFMGLGVWRQPKDGNEVQR